MVGGGQGPAADDPERLQSPDCTAVWPTVCGRYSPVGVATRLQQPPPSLPGTVRAQSEKHDRIDVGVLLPCLLPYPEVTCRVDGTESY
jgi:hypothetical protein